MVSETKDTARGRLFKFSEMHPHLFCLIAAFLINSAIEILSRHSLVGYLSCFITSPFSLIYSVIVITLTLHISLLFRRRHFVFALIALIWLGMGIANGVLLLFRVTPLTAVDFSVIWSVLGIISIYLKPWQIGLICAAFVIAAAGLVLLAVKIPKTERLLRRGLISVCLLIVMLFLATNIGLETGALSESFTNLADAYDTYGFTYCFGKSLLDKGIDRPQSYREKILSLQKRLDPIIVENAAADAPDKIASTARPNIVMVQLESFFDPLQLKNCTFSRDPIPYFRSLTETCPGGFLSVPVVGAGTVNTEFEILCGMNSDFFGTGEYPYKTVLMDTATETLCTDLKANGYTAHAMHNNTGTFYDRHIVYASLGFDTFTPLEYMKNQAKNILGWTLDSVLTDEIIRALEKTAGRDFVFAVSVQAHGKYPRDEVANGSVSVSCANDEKLANAAEYYANELSSVDGFIKDLTDTLSEYDEPVLLVLYGDHLPALDVTDDSVETGDIFKTQYVIWSNYGFEAENRDLEAYELSARIMNLLGFEGGPVLALHTLEAESEDFDAQLEMLQYDMLYGDCAVFGGENPYEKTNMAFGLEDIFISGITVSKSSSLITGSGFSPSSTVYINGAAVPAEYINSSSLLLRNFSVNEGDTAEVRIAADDGYVFSSVFYPEHK